jgi:hypothetical protein
MDLKLNCDGRATFLRSFIGQPLASTSNGERPGCRTKARREPRPPRPPGARTAFEWFHGKGLQRVTSPKLCGGRPAFKLLFRWVLRLSFRFYRASVGFGLQRSAAATQVLLSAGATQILPRARKGFAALNVYRRGDDRSFEPHCGREVCKCKRF